MARTKKDKMIAMEAAIRGGTMRVHEVASFTGMAQSTVRKLIKLGRLRVTKPNGCVLVLREDVTKMLVDGMKRRC